MILAVERVVQADIERVCLEQGIVHSSVLVGMADFPSQYTR
jgi:hypothetical protein